jgi:glucose/arabinose dehydrogenase
MLAMISCTDSSSKDAAETQEVDNKASEMAAANEPRLASLKLPDGFKISIYAKNIENARSMAMGTQGTLFIGNRSEGKVWAVRDVNKDGVADSTWLVAEGLNMPNGIAFKDGSLYVAEVSKLWRYDNIEANMRAIPAPKLIYDDFPTDKHHGWKYIAFGPDGKLYVPVGAPCNICESKNEMYASIMRMNADGTNREIYAKGVRNTVGFTWHPESGEMWFTDNGRDMLGDDIPPCELNKAPTMGMHFGYPYCHGGDIADPDFGGSFPCSDFTAPALKLGAHVAPLGLKFYTGKMFPASYSGSLFIAEHGSWNRSKKVGYKITKVTVENGKATSQETFIDGWLDEAAQEAWGRPVDILNLEDGSMLISDDKAGIIYRVTYQGA